MNKNNSRKIQEKSQDKPVGMKKRSSLVCVRSLSNIWVMLGKSTLSHDDIAWENASIPQNSKIFENYVLYMFKGFGRRGCHHWICHKNRCRFMDSNRFFEFLNKFDKFVFSHFPMLWSSGNPPGGSRDTRDRFYIDRLFFFHEFSYIFHIFPYCPFIIHF